MPQTAEDSTERRRAEAELRLLRTFQRVHSRNEYEGAGIGLALCRKIVEWHGGSITARSVPGEGSIFVVTLLLRQPAQAVH